MSTTLPGTDLAPALIAALVKRGQTVATCESLTGGLVCGALTSVPGCSAVVRGGLVTYATELKLSLAGVDPATAAGGVVTEQTAVEMAFGARAACGADWGLATTGVAGPGPQDGVAAGTVWIAIVGPGAFEDPTVVTRRLSVTGDREAVRTASVHELFRELSGVLDVAIPTRETGGVAPQIGGRDR